MGAAGCLWVRRYLLGWLLPYPRERWERAHQALLTHALGWVMGAARRCLGFNVVVSENSKDGVLRGTDPALVLARHGGPGDSFALVHLLLSRYGRRVRIVLKEILQLDPAMDILLNRLGCRFIPSTRRAHADATTERLSTMARDLDTGDVLLIFPEGGNWTPRRRSRIISHFERTAQFRAARQAGLMTNVLPPRPGGVLACLDARPGLPVVIIAHAGLDRLVRVSQAWRRLPLSQPMTVRIWPPSAVPAAPTDRLAWLTTEWAVIDQWIEGYHTGSLDAVPPGAASALSELRPD
jgi:1-acyl-sn-glycerol-3-phosphate acyltransferase